MNDITKFAEKASRAVEILEQGFDDAVAVLDLPEYYRRKPRTTNSVERLNREIRRRISNSLAISPNPLFYGCPSHWWHQVGKVGQVYVAGLSV